LDGFVGAARGERRDRIVELALRRDHGLSQPSGRRGSVTARAPPRMRSGKMRRI
jgi:hypothetical protein